jgi:hypothetical protein
LPRVEPSYSERHASSVHDLRYANRRLLRSYRGLDKLGRPSIPQDDTAAVASRTLDIPSRRRGQFL